jgi:hypothetical protein
VRKVTGAASVMNSQQSLTRSSGLKYISQRNPIAICREQRAYCEKANLPLLPGDALWAFRAALGSAQSSAGVERLLDKINRLPGTERQQKLVEGARTVVAGCHSHHSRTLVPSETALAVTQ